MANTENCPKVGIVMGSDSDMPVMAKAADILEELGIPYEMTVISAHREPDVFFEYAKSAEEKGFKVIIAGAGMAAHLPGTSDAELLGKLKAYSTKLKEQVEAKDAKLQEIGYKAYLEGMKK